MPMISIVTGNSHAMALLLFLMFVLVVYGRPVTARDITVNINGNDTEDCLEGDYPCSSLGYVLNHLQSNDCVNITSNSVPLTTIVELHNLNAITIRGQGNTIVMCNNTGGVSCNNCSNIVIEGITWDGCGDPLRQVEGSSAGLAFVNLTNLSINYCILQNSETMVLYLHMVAGLINITGTQVINNANCGVIHCVSVQPSDPCCTTSNHTAFGGVYIYESFRETMVSVSNCRFSGNGYFGEFDNGNPACDDGKLVNAVAMTMINSNAETTINLSLKNTVFISNRGYHRGAVYISSTNSEILFYNTSFADNSVLKSDSVSSALMIQLNPLSTMTMINLSFCDFTNNRYGQNVVGLIMYGQPTHLIVAHSNFADNKMYQVGLVEMSMQSSSIIDFVHSDFYNNTGSALLYLDLHSASLSISLHNVQAADNYGTSISRRDGLLAFQVFEEHCIIDITELNFTNNHFERDGGGIYINGIVRKSFKFYLKDSQLQNNIGHSSGTVMYSEIRSDIAILYSIYNSSFISNSGGTSIVRLVKRSDSVTLDSKPGILLLGKSTIFANNLGGALSIDDTLLIGVGNTTFQSNTVDNGAGLLLGDSYILLNISNFRFNFIQNFAFGSGGAILVEFPTNFNATNCNWIFPENSDEICSGDVQKAEGCPVIDGKLLCSEITPQIVDNSQLCNFEFVENSASLAGNAIYYGIEDLMKIENSSNPNSIFYLPQDNFCFDTTQSSDSKDLSTRPFLARLKEPAKCIDTDCVTYYITDIMLGEVIEIPAQIVGANNKSAESVAFFVTCEENCTTSNGSTNYMITGTIPVLISDKLGGIKITGIQNGPTLKLQLMSATITLHLVVELVPCRSGYTYSKETMQCECYTTDDVVSCTPQTTIKRDHWFGMVDNATTVSRCPYTYCNFDRQEVSPGRFLLPSVQDDQCDSHRTGPACGSCDDGYTIPFDSVECINVDNCHPGYTVLVIIGVMVYWVIVIVVSFFSLLLLRHIKCNIGYLYGTIYYYSVIDVLLGEIVNRSNGLTLLIQIFGGTIFKLYPGFLYKVCLIEGMDTIDQYIIHYVHPMAVLVLIWLFSQLARCSLKFSHLIGDTTTPMIILALVLGYMPISGTSLQLLRFLQFEDIDGTFIYLSPTIEYFTGRHIAYLFLAVFNELTIGIGLPVLLLFQPYLSTKTILTRFKPLFKHFQACYKDGWFAAIYLLFRQAILIIVFVHFADPYIEQYLLMIVCILVALVHYVLQPYKSVTLNKYDGILLYALLLVVSLRLIASSNGFTTDATVGVSYVFYFLPVYVSALFVSRYIIAKKFFAEPDNTAAEPETSVPRVSRSVIYSHTSQTTYIDKM